MGSSRPEKVDKKEKKRKNKETHDGVSKPRSDRKERKEKKVKKEKLQEVVLAAVANSAEGNKPQPPASDDDKDATPEAAPAHAAPVAPVATAKRSKKPVAASDDEDQDKSGTVQVGPLVPFAHPLADERVTRKLHKSVKRAAKHKCLRRGVKEVVKALRKADAAGPSNPQAFPGVVIVAGDVSPMDIISHIPCMCEDVNVPYVFVTSRAALGAAGGTKRPTSVVLVSEKRVSGNKARKDGDATDDAAAAAEHAAAYADLVKLVKKETKKLTFL